jgi:hypothetical protein
MNRFYIKTGQLKSCLLFLLLLTGLQTFASPVSNVPATPPPNWSINPDDYEFNMSAVIRLEYTGVPTNLTNNLVGAFVGNQLRGVASPVIINGNAYFFLSIYSNEYTGETVRFKGYYAPNDEIYGAFEQATFIHNSTIGNSTEPFWIDLDPNADFPPELDPILADTTLQNIPFETVDLNTYLYSGDGDPVIWSAQPGPNLTATIVNGILTVTPVSNAWIGTDSVRIIVTENTPNQLADTITGWFTVLPDYGAPVWQNIPGQTIFTGQQFSSFDLDNYLNYNGPCRKFDFDVFPYAGSDSDPAWPVVVPGNQPMTVIARPLFADIQLAGAGAKLAGFVNGNLAGWASPVGSPPNVSYTLVLKNVGAGNITFRFYDAGRQYLYEEATNLAYAAGGTVGTIASPYLIQLSPLVPSLDANGVISIAIDDPTWMGSYPIDFIVWDCDYPNLRRDTFQAIFSIISDIRPEINSAIAVNFEENACSTLYDTETTDPNNSEGNGLSYALAGGADVSKFAINAQNGILSWASGFSPDFEAPADANTDNKYQVNIKVTNAANLSDTLGLTVTITNQNPEPFTAKINGGNSLLCTNGTANLQATGGVSYLWNTGSTLADIIVSTAGTYTVTVTSTGSCTLSASIVVAPQPSITASGSGVPVCIGTNINLKSTPTGGSTPYASFAWSGPNGYSANVEDPAGFPATPAAAGTYTVTLTDAAGCTATASTTITVSGSSAPTIAAGSNSPVCDGASLSLNSTPSGGSGSGYTFLWSGPNSFAATAQNPTPFTATPAAAGTYQVVVTDGAGCTGTGTTSVQVNSKPVITASSNSPVSVGGTILLSSTVSGGSGNGYTYVWSGPNGYSSTDAQPAGFTASLASAGVYNVTVTDSNGCTGTSTTNVSVVACPTITATVSGAVCEGGMVTLQSTPAGGALPYASFAWSGPNGYSANVEDPASFQANMSANGTYTVTVTDQLGCSATATTTVVVNPNPSITAQNNGPHCAGATAIVSSTPSGGTPGYTFLWTGPDFFGANSEDPAPFTATVPANGIYQVKVTDSKGCTATATTNMVVNAKPSISASNNGPLCIDATLDLNANPAGGSGVYTFNWSGPSGFSANIEDPKRPLIKLIHAGTYNVTVTDNQGCSATASTTLSISTNNAPSITASSNSPLCAGSQLTLTSNATLGTPPYTAYAWSGPNTYSSTMEDPTPFVVFLNGAGVYNVTVTDTKNCKGTASVTVIVTSPSLNPSSNSPVCPGATLQLNSGGPSGSGVTYSWTGPNNFTSGLSNPSIANATPAASGTYFVTVNDNGCIGTSSVTASVSDVVPPTISCPANTTLAADANCSSQLGTYAATSVSDNCNPNPTVTQSPVSTTVLSGHNFVQTVTLTANDGNGNTASCTFTVTLKDVTPPSITCPANTTVAADANCAGVVGSHAPAAVSDNCTANPTITQSPASNTVLSGHNDVETITLTADDGNGNTASCTFTVTLKDVTPPSITCPANMTVAADANCSGIVGAHAAVSVSDNCAANPTVTQSPAPSTVLNGHNDVETVTLTADDGNGNTASCTFTVTLKDITPPSITCPSNLTVAADANCSGVVGSRSPVSVSDNCNPNPTVTQSPAANTPLNGHNDVETVTLTADDGNGNTASCSFTVTLKDVTPPTIVCPANMTVAADANCAGVVGSHAPVSVSDNCNPNPTVTQSPAPSTVLSGHNDVETVTLTADDGNGNTASCTFTVTLKDVTPPSITCPANMTVAADANCSGVVGSHAPVAVSDNCNANPTVTQSPAPSTVLSGHNDVETVTLTANDGNGNTASCTFTVTLKDITPPTITCPANMTVAADANCSGVVGSHAPVAVGDNCTANPVVTQSPAPSTVLNGHNDVETITLTADDGNGNTTSCTFTVTLKDVTPPTVVCKPFTAALNAAGMATITTGDVYQSGADNCGVVNQVSVVPNTFTCANLGPNTVVLTVNDGNGNTATCNAVVTVVDLIPPTMLCKSIIVALNAAGNVSVTPAQVNNGSFDNCTLSTLTLAPNSFNCSNLGSNTVTLTGTDQSGNTATCQTTVVVIDTIKPVMICKNATIDLNANGQATLVVADVNNGSFDNCTITFSLSQTLFTCANIGSNLVTLTGTDQAGNTGACTATVTVRDLIPPVAKCKNVVANLGANGMVTVPPASVDNGSTDNCGFTLGLNPSTFACSNIGINVVTLTVTDAGGNARTCTARVTVKDATPPTALCKNITITLNDIGQASITIAQVDNGSTDNCSIASRSLLKTQFTCGDIAAPVNNTLTITDGSGNVSTCIAQITVKDVFAPTAICKNTTVSLVNGSATVYPNILADSSFDNCSITTYLPVSKTYFSAGTFNLLITVKDWSGNAATCTSVVTVLPNGPSEKPGDALKLAVYPNPSEGPVNLEFILPQAQGYYLTVYDLTGMAVMHQKGTGVEGLNMVPVLLSNLAPGIYFLEVKSEQLKARRRLMLKN